MRKALPVALAIIAIIGLGGAARGDTRVDRLAHLARLWGTVKFADPYVWTHDVDLDRLLLDAIPRVSAAGTVAEYRAAVAAMLAGLGDPVTRVVDAAERPGPVPAAEGPFTRTAGGVLVVTLRRLARATPVKDAVATLSASLAPARPVVFDLRGADSLTATAFFAELGNVFAPRRLVAPVARRVFHSGYRPQDGFGSGGYTTGERSDAAEEIAARAGARAGRTVFLVSNESPVPSIVFALAAAGAGWVVSDGRLIPEVELPVDMGEGVQVSVRGSELFPAVKADVEIASGKDALAAALALARATRTKKPAPAAPAASVRWRPDATYADAAYPSKELRLLALFRYWNVIRFFYPYLALIGDWDAVLPELIPRFEEAPDALAYGQAVAELTTRVPDGHSRQRGSPALAAYLGEGRPPILVRMVEGRPVVVKVREPELGLKVGDILVSVDGEPVERRAERLGKLVSASTSAAHAQYVAALLLAGPVDATAKVTVTGADDRAREVEIPRRKPVPPPDPPKDEVVKILPGNIGFVDLNYLEVADVPAMFTRLQDTRAIVFDLRGYPRGTAWTIAPRINRNHARIAAHFERNELDGGEPRRMMFDQRLGQWAGPIYANPTVMLIDDRTISQAEHTGLFLEAAGGTKFVGSNTAGANGDVTTIVLPGGISVWMTGHDVRHADGRQLQRIGLVPDVRVEPTIKGLREGRDEVLEAALRSLAATK